MKKLRKKNLFKKQSPKSISSKKEINLLSQINISQTLFKKIKQISNTNHLSNKLTSFQ